MHKNVRSAHNFYLGLDSWCLSQDFLGMDLMFPKEEHLELSQAPVIVSPVPVQSHRCNDVPIGSVTTFPLGITLPSREGNLPTHLPPEAVGSIATIVSPENIDRPPVVVGSVDALDRSQDSHTLSTLGGTADGVFTDSVQDAILELFASWELSSNSGVGHEDTVPSYITIPYTNDVIWHEGAGYIFDEQPSVATFSYAGGVYRGDVNENGVPHGIGYLIFNNDVYYFGNWFSGVEHGFGILVWANGTFSIDLFNFGRKCFQTNVMSLATNYCSVIRDIHKWPSTWFNFAY